MKPRISNGTTSSILDALTDAGRSALLERSVEKHYSTGETLWAAGDTATCLTIVLEGRVRVIRAQAGRQFGVHSGEPGSTLGEVPFFTKSPYPATAIAAEPTRCLLVPYRALDHALRMDPSLAFALLERMSSRVASLVDRLSELSGERVQSRLARFILARAESRPAGLSFSFGITQSELAEELGTVREVVVKELRVLRNDGAIESAGNGRYRLLDEKRLRSIVLIGA